MVSGKRTREQEQGFRLFLFSFFGVFSLSPQISLSCLSLDLPSFLLVPLRKDFQDFQEDQDRNLEGGQWFRTLVDGWSLDWLVLGFFGFSFLAGGVAVAPSCLSPLLAHLAPGQEDRIAH